MIEHKSINQYQDKAFYYSEPGNEIESSKVLKEENSSDLSDLKFQKPLVKEATIEVRIKF